MSCLPGFRPDVSPTVFKGLDEGYETHKIRLSVYNEDCQCLMITFPTQVHEELGGTLYGQLYDHIVRMGLGQRWAFKGHATFYNTRYPTRSAGAKQADSSGGPREGHPRDLGGQLLCLTQDTPRR